MPRSQATILLRSVSVIKGSIESNSREAGHHLIDATLGLAVPPRQRHEQGACPWKREFDEKRRRGVPTKKRTPFRCPAHEPFT